MEEKIIRPTTKPEAIKGKLLKYQGTDYCEFMPQAQGEPQYEGISKTRHSQLKRSKGKAPKLVAHLTAQAESAPAVEASTLDLKGLAPATAQPFKGKKVKKKRWLMNSTTLLLLVGMRRQHVLRLKFIIFVILLHKCLNYKRNRN